MLSEFGLIERFFTRADAPSKRAALGVGDDCALLDVLPGHQLAISTDMLVAGRHFFPDVDPFALGHKSLAVNLSDLAAMGAEPRAFTLSLALPRIDETWLAGFSTGLFALADRFGCELIGGDTTAGPLTISITVFGDLPIGAALRRDRAQAGDDIWVSGTLGDARLALGLRRGEWGFDGAAAAASAALNAPGSTTSSACCGPVSTPDFATLVNAMERPEPRIALGLALRGVAHAALDISDGLAGDLQHVLDRSRMCALVDADAVPRSATLAARSPAIQRQCTLAGGDDYELCFSAPASARAAVERAGAAAAVRVTRIGRIASLRAPSSAGSALAPARASGDSAAHAASHPGLPAPGIVWHDGTGVPFDANVRGFDHFHAD